MVLVNYIDVQSLGVSEIFLIIIIKGQRFHRRQGTQYCRALHGTGYCMVQCTAGYIVLQGNGYCRVG